MRKGILAGILAVALMLTPAGLAEVYEGHVTAMSATTLEAETAGTLDTLNVQEGDIISLGDVVGSVRTDKVFANQDGTVAIIQAVDDANIAGTALELMPVERFRIYCTVDKAYQSPEATLVHAGEQVYIKCTSDGSHRGIGLISQIDGSEFQVLAIGGELYLGETVYLYRDAEFSTEQRVGIGTVVANDTEAYDAEGYIVKLHVSEGEYVERGELLFEYVRQNGAELTASAGGIVTEVTVKQGDVLRDGQAIMSIVSLDELCVEIFVDERAASEIAVGSVATLTYDADPQELSQNGTVVDISWIASGGQYSVRIVPDDTQNLRLGMTAMVQIAIK